MEDDIYTTITNKIIEQLEKGVRPWLQPWSAGNADGKITLPLRQNDKPYNGINVIMLWSKAMDEGYANSKWMTARQANHLGGHVRKGEKGARVVYADSFKKTDIDENTGEEIEQDIPFLKGYAVFNVEQIEGLPADYYTAPEPKLDTDERIIAAEEYLDNIPSNVRHGGNRAYYTPGRDFIQMPHFEFFNDPESYYGTRLHETVHWTRHPSRLDRDFGRKKWGDQGYAMEELVAEIGSAFLSSIVGTEPELREDHASYIDNWIKVLKDDKRAIFKAAAYAQKAVDFIGKFQNGLENKPDLNQNKQFTQNHNKGGRLEL